MKFCLECKKSFIPDTNHPFQDFCSKVCRELSIKKNNKCIDCGQSLNSRAKYAGTQRCRVCIDLFKKGKFPKGGFKIGQTKGKSNLNYKHGKYTVDYFCIDCGKEISDASAIFGRGRCGKCYWDFKKGKKRAGNPNNWKHTEETKQKMKLAHIGKFWKEESKRKLSLSKGGTGIPYEHNLYPEDFFRKRYNIMKRDNFTCQICKQYGTKGKNYLSIHHIDYDKNNNSDNNLITLCKRDNIKVNFNKDNWIKLFKEKITNILTKNREIPE